MGRNKFQKEERLKSREQILSLFKEGNTTKAGNIKLIWKYDKLPKSETNSPYIKVGFSVPKRKIKKAVQRNRIKRKLREIYRLQKDILLDSLKNKNIKLNLFVIYLAEVDFSYHHMEKNFISAAKKMTDTILNSKIS
ncbi:MAG: ribonuclease P protein component [Bacteroidales bacterium]